MNYSSNTQICRHQGIALFGFVILLLVSTLGLLSSSTTTAIQQKISANYHQSHNCLQSAETAAYVAANNLTAQSYSKNVTLWDFQFENIVPTPHSQPTTAQIRYRYSMVPTGFSFGVGITANHYDIRAEAKTAASRCPLEMGFFRLSPA